MRSFSIALAVSLAWIVAGADGTAWTNGTDGTNGTKGQLALDTLVVTFTGDLLLDRGVRRLIETTDVSSATEVSSSPDLLFTPAVDSLFARSQVVVANLECPATTVKAPVFKRFIFRAEPEWLHALRRHGITHLNLANNHSIDQGRHGLMDTRRNIIQAGLTPVGADSTMAAAAQPVLLAQLPSPRGGVGGRGIWLLTSVRMTLENFAYLPDRPSVSQEPMDSLLRRVNRLRRQDPSAVIIVSLHWGAEHTLKPVPAQRHDAHRLIDAGADALVCHHTHTLQTVETYRGKPIYYSIGNFIFDQQRPENSRAALVTLKVTADTVIAQTIPIDIRRCVPHILE